MRQEAITPAIKGYNQLKVPQRLNCMHGGYTKEKESKWLKDVAQQWCSHPAWMRP